MRIAVLSDIHGNLEALRAVLADLERAGADALYSLGDIVGYGPEPAGSVELVCERAAVSLLGNHDAAAVGLTPLEEFNEFARWAIEWSAGQLGAGHRRYLAALPYTCREGDDVFAHASPTEPERWHYIHGARDLEEPFAVFEGRVCFVGHSHRPGVYEVGPGRQPRRLRSEETLRAGSRYVINVGSVGQPRDRNPLASYALYDRSAGAVALRRVSYPVARTQQLMRAAGMPSFLVDRIAAGL